MVPLSHLRYKLSVFLGDKNGSQLSNFAKSCTCGEPVFTQATSEKDLEMTPAELAFGLSTDYEGLMAEITKRIKKQEGGLLWWSSG